MIACVQKVVFSRMPSIPSVRVSVQHLIILIIDRPTPRAQPLPVFIM